jgi:endonuclease/exonuclease/phosphatase family metal-dependent hydrolase
MFAQPTTCTRLNAFQRSLNRDHVYVKGCPPQAENHQDPTARSVIRILTWNIERGYRPEQIAAALAAIRPDIACLQEVDWGNRRTGGRDVLQELAEVTGMLGLYGIEFLEICSPRRPEHLAGGGAIGNALLCRLAPQDAFRIELPTCLDWESDATDSGLPRLTRWRLRREERIGRRFGVGAEFEWNGRRLLVCSVHLEDKLGGVGGRWWQFKAVEREMEGRCGDAALRVIAGDFNTFDCRMARVVMPGSGGPALGRPAGVPEAAWWQDALLPDTGYADPFAPTAWTFRILPFFWAKLDWITIKGGLAINCGVGPFATSDHRPVWLDLEASAPTISEQRSWNSS